MATNKFYEFNEQKNDILTDEEYLNSKTRAGGVSTGLAKSNLHNKLYRQSSVMNKALGQVIADRGFNASDADVVPLAEAIKGAFPSTPKYCLIARDAEGKVIMNNAFKLSASVDLTGGRETFIGEFTANEDMFYISFRVDGGDYINISLKINDAEIVSVNTGINEHYVGVVYIENIKNSDRKGSLVKLYGKYTRDNTTSRVLTMCDIGINVIWEA